MQLSLDQEKLARISALVLPWHRRRYASKQELQSLIGHLSHAAIVIQHGHTFLCRMIDLMKWAKHLHHHIRLSAEFRSELHLWALFLLKRNDRSILRQPDPSHIITADASGSWRCGAFSSNGSCFQLQLPRSWSHFHIAAKEMVPVVIAIAV